MGWPPMIAVHLELFLLALGFWRFYRARND
jgi:hypothetical protein